MNSRSHSSTFSIRQSAMVSAPSRPDRYPWKARNTAAWSKYGRAPNDAEEKIR